MGFNLQDELQSLDFDFRPHADVHGTVPEPSEKQVRAFRRGLIAAAREAMPAGSDPQAIVSPSQAIGVLSNLDPDALDAQDDAAVRLIADVCGNALSVQQLKKVPPRGRQKFLGWLVGNVLGTTENPTPSNPDISRSLATANGAAVAG